MDLIETIKTKKEAIEKSSKKPQWKTNCSFGYTDDVQGRENIAVVRDKKKLIAMYAFLVQKEQAIQIALKELEVSTEIEHLGFSITEWKEDIKLRVNQICIEQKKKELEELYQKVNSLVSSEQKRQMEIQSVLKSLDKMQISS